MRSSGAVVVGVLAACLPAVSPSDPAPGAGDPPPEQSPAPGPGTASERAVRWPSWRGPGSTGSALGDGYAARFGATEGFAWKRELPGAGRSTPIVWDDHIIVTTPADGQDAVVDLAGSGEVRWTAAIGKERPGKHRNASGSNPSPVTDGRRIFAYFKSGNLAALDFDGRVQWRTNLQERFGEDSLWWDVGTSPVLTARHVVVAVLQTGESYLAAFDKMYGRLAWKVSRNFECALEGDQSYATPLVVERDGREAILVWGGEHLTEHDANDGSALWSCGGFNPDRTSNWVTVASAVVAGGNVIVPWGRGGFLSGVRTGGTGDVTGTHRAWTRPDAAAFVPTPATDGRRVWVVRDRGEVLCLDAATGEVSWKLDLPRDRSSYYASPTVAGGNLYAAREDGRVFVLRIDGTPEVLASNDLGEPIIASPVPAGGRLLLRGERHLFCVAESGERMLFGDTTRLGRPFAKDPAAIRFGGRYLLYYSVPPSADPGGPGGWGAGIAESRDLTRWTRVGEVLPKEDYEAKGLAAPEAIVLDGKVHLFYQTYGNGPRDAICHAVSEDGLEFRRDPTNPIFRPTGAWTSGRAIDAEVFEHAGRLFLVFATRDPAMKVQMLGVAAADRASDLGRDAWRQLVDGPILRPELPWERSCIEAASVCRRGDRLWMFYAGGYNNEPQQIGAAWSLDGVSWTRIQDDPLLPNGAPGEWNSSESGHPGVFIDDDGSGHLFFQGNDDGGKTWRLSRMLLRFDGGRPRLVRPEDGREFPMQSPAERPEGP